MIQAQGLSRSYGSFEAVSQFSFTARPGEVVGLLGRNGAGKSTLMNMLAGCLAPTRGKVLVKGLDLAESPLEARRHLGYLPEVPPLYPELTVKEYLQFGCSLKGVKKAGQAKHLEEIISLAGLEPVKNQLIARLSKGFRQRAGLAQALVGSPEVLLLDEPTAGFDPLQALAFRKLISRLARDRVIIFSSHLLTEVQEICGRVLIIHQGKLMKDHPMGQLGQSIHYRLVVKAAPEKVLSPIRQLPMVKRAQLVSRSQPDSSRLMMEAEAGDGFPPRLFTLLTGLNAPILELTPVQDTLESLFLQVTGQGEAQP